MNNNCTFYNDCFTCPFPDCILDTGIKKVSLERKKRAMDLHNSGMGFKQIVLTLGVPKRQVERYLKEQVENKQAYILRKYEEE